MKRLLLPLLFAVALPAGAVEDTRQFVQMPAPAQAVLRAEMVDMLVVLHDAGSEFATIAKTGDAAKALAALPKLTGQCVSCHTAYRTR